MGINHNDFVLRPPGVMPGANFYSTPEVIEDSLISIPYTLFDPEGEPLGRLDASFSLDGGGTWLSAQMPEGAAVAELDSTSLLLTSAVYNRLLSIPDGSSIQPTLFIPQSGLVGEIEMWLNITHSLDSDLSVVLIAPDNTSLTLFDGVGGRGQNFLGTVLYDRTTTPIASGAAPFTGRYISQNSLSVFQGKSLNGTWALKITDKAAGGTGKLAGWGLRTHHPSTGALLTAWIGERLCGQAELQSIPGFGPAFNIAVYADDGRAYAGCGLPGRQVIFRLGDQALYPQVAWNNDRVWQVDLYPPLQLFLPLVGR